MDLESSPSKRHATYYQTYDERADAANVTPLAHYLFRLMHLKRTNLCVSADVTTTAELLKLAEEVGEHIVVFKTHIDIVSDFGDRTVRALNNIAREKQFVVFEDRKFGDIGNTVQQQYVGGPLQIVKWAPIVNAHIFPGPAIITALSQAAQKAVAQHNTSVSTDISASPALSHVGSDSDESDAEDPQYTSRRASAANALFNIDDDDADSNDERRARKASVVSVTTTINTKTETLSPQPRPSLSRCTSTEEDSDPIDNHRQLEELGPPPFYRSLLLLAQMSSANNFFTPAYTEACLENARLHRDFVMGFIAQRAMNVAEDDNFIVMTPGVQLSAGGDALGQQYNTPRKVIVEAGTDVIIVGRGIYAASNRRQAALDYRRQGWTAYEERIKAGQRQR